MLTTFVKLAYADGFTVYEVTFAQTLLGFLGLTLLNIFYKGKTSSVPLKGKALTKARLKLVLAGTSLGLTSISYYFSVRYVSVSLGIVLLMQSVWMGVLLEAILTKKRPTLLKIVSVIVILFGTVLATNIWSSTASFDYTGILFGILAACSYTITIYTSNTVATELPSINRSKWMMTGGFLIVLPVVIPALINHFNLEIFYVWGPLLAVLGTMLPPLLLTQGMPKINVGLGVIITSMELPVSILMAYFVLQEVFLGSQWLGVLLILMAVALMNLRKVKRNKT